MIQTHKNNERFILVSLSVLFLLFLSGCWSSKEIEDLGLVVGTAIDLENEETLGGELQITITNQLVTSQTAGSGVKEGGSQGKNYKNVSETGDSIITVIRDMILKIEQRLFAQHIKVIVIGEDLARTLNLQHTLDFFLREQEVRPSSLVLIAKNHASQILESADPNVVPAFKLVQISKGQERTTKILSPMSLSKLNGKMHSGSSFLLQNVVSLNGDVKFEGAAVFKGKTKKLQGFLNEMELKGVTWLTGKGKGGLVRSFDEETGNPIMYEILSMKSSIKPYVDGDNISFDVEIQSEGRIGEYWGKQGEPFKSEFLKRAEKATEKEVKRMVKNVLNKTQKEYQVDVLGFGNRLRIEYPRVWEKVKKDWDKTFSEVPIKFKVNLTIKDYGVSVD